MTITPALTFSLELLPILLFICSSIPISSIIPATIPRWSRFDTLISLFRVLIILSSFLAFSLPFVNYFTFPLRAECGDKFLDFIIQSHSENSDLDVVTLQESLESQGFSEEYALDLSIKYEFGKELLNKFAQAI